MIRNYLKAATETILQGNIKNNFNNVNRANLATYGTPTINKFITSTSTANIQNQISVRYKSRSSKNKQKRDSDTDSYKEEDFIDEIQDKNTKVVNVSVTSLRVDGILKSALGIARNKIETMFYESKIRVNGDKISKKSVMVQEGDEIDVIKGPDVKNPNFTNVARVEILAIKPAEDNISVKIRRCKSLSIDGY